MSRFKLVKFFARDFEGGDWPRRTIKGFTTLPVSWPDKPSRKRTSSKGSDNLHRLYKELRRILPYGTVMKHAETIPGKFTFHAPNGYGFIDYPGSKSPPYYLPTTLTGDLVNHYSNVHDRLSRVKRMALARRE